MEQDRDAYDEYSASFKNELAAEHYRESSVLARPRNMLDAKKLSGYLTSKAEIGAIRRLLTRCHGRVVLDIPCGTGKAIEDLTNLGYEIVGIDASKEMLARCEIKTPGTQLFVGDIRRLPLKDASFDIVLCNRFFHRIPTRYHAEALKEITRVGRKYFILYYGSRSLLTSVVIKLEKAFGLGDRGRIFYLTRQGIAEELHDHGLRIIHETFVIPLLSSGHLVAVEKVDRR
jgi:SAM-dependent methyltransferase